MFRQSKWFYFQMFRTLGLKKIEIFNSSLAITWRTLIRGKNFEISEFRRCLNMNWIKSKTFQTLKKKLRISYVQLYKTIRDRRKYNPVELWKVKMEETAKNSSYRGIRDWRCLEQNVGKRVNNRPCYWASLIFLPEFKYICFQFSIF